MFRHKGKTRTLRHNLRIASFLSFVAGIVNVVGFLAVQRLTTNVTGHFAFFIDEVFKMNFWKGLGYFLYILFFFLGSFVSSFMVETIARRNNHYVYILPTLTESFILFFASFFGNFLVEQNPNLLAFILLFAMGFQNSLVTKISRSRVRTTHLTGLFTDLGIELSQLFFYKEPEQKYKLLSSIGLRVTIIFFFFLGGLLAGILYTHTSLGVYTLIIGALILILAVIYDEFKLTRTLKKRRI